MAVGLRLSQFLLSAGECAENLTLRTSRFWVRREDPARKADKKYVPYIPAALVTETVGFLKNNASVRALLNLQCSPLSPSDTVADRREFTRARELFAVQDRMHSRPFRQHERFAEEAAWRAQAAVPANFYAEITAPAAPLPETLALHHLMRRSLLASLTSCERRLFQVYAALFYLRFPFLREKRANPGLFWIAQTGSVNRARVALLSKGLKRWKN